MITTGNTARQDILLIALNYKNFNEIFNIWVGYRNTPKSRCVKMKHGLSTLKKHVFFYLFLQYAYIIFLLRNWAGLDNFVRTCTMMRFLLKKVIKMFLVYIILKSSHMIFSHEDAGKF